MAKFYFVQVRRRSMLGNLPNGQYRGIYGWRNGLNGPHTKTEAERIRALIGGEIIPVEVDDSELLGVAEETAELDAPTVMAQGLPKDEDSAEDEAPQEVPSEDTGEDADEEDADKEGETVEESVAELVEKAVATEYPGFHEARSIMKDAGFEYEGRDGDSVEAAWKEFVAQLGE